jgi:AMP deaminase
MRFSRQRLGDNPRDHDGSFTGLDEDLQDVVGVRPDADYASRMKPKHQFPRWKIYPEPLPPHWHFKEDAIVAPNEAKVTTSAKEAFDYSKCEIPGEDARAFVMDERGVYQVYAEEDCESLVCTTSCTI